MKTLKKIGLSDVRVGKKFWAEWDTYFNGEGGLAGVGIVKDIAENTVDIEFFMSGTGLQDDKFGLIDRIYKKDISSGKLSLFRATNDKINAFINKMISRQNEEIAVRTETVRKLEALLAK